MACQPQMPSERSAGTGHLSDALRQQNAAAHAQALMRTFVCTRCLKELLRDQFWPGDVNNRGSRALVCKTCQPLAPSERAAAKTYTCEYCGEDKVKDDFWHHDLKHRWGDTLGCKLCKPIPPQDRKSKAAAARAKALAASSSRPSSMVSSPAVATQCPRKRRRSKGAEVFAAHAPFA